MIKIRFFSSFCDTDNCISVYERICELKNDTLYNKNYCFVNDDNYTHAIIINTAMPNLTISKENVVGIAFEPLQFLSITKNFIEYAKKHIGIYYIGENPNNVLPELFKEHFGYMWYITPLSKFNLFQMKKTRMMSIMVSNKVYASGHKYRHELCKKILESDLPIDIYGRGSKFYSHLNDNRVKGTFNDKELYLDYSFHICIENYITPHYFSEKIINPLLCETTPIYLGCKNIDSYFPDNVIHLTGNVENDFKLLKHICEEPQKYKKNIDIEQIKKTVSITQLIKKLNWI